MVNTNVGNYGDQWLQNIGGVQTTTESGLYYGQIDALSMKVLKSQGSD